MISGLQPLSGGKKRESMSLKDNVYLFVFHEVDSKVRMDRTATSVECREQSQ